jgi:hypothetical protein
VTNYIHPRFSLSQVERFAPFIALAVAKWPEETRFEGIQGMSPYTFSARLRDAIKSYRMYKWPTLGIDEAKFNQIDGTFQIRDPDASGHVYWAHKSTKGRNPSGAVGCETIMRPKQDLPKSQRVAHVTPNQLPTRGPLSVGPLPLDFCDTNGWAIVTKLVNDGFVPVVQIVGELDEAVQSYLMDNFPNVGVAYDPDVNRTVIM